MPKLSIQGPEGQTREIELDDRDLRIGRGEQNEIVLLDATKSVSRVHAELRFENGRYVLVDNNSQNGIWAGGQRLPNIPLQPGVPVLVGSYRLVLDDAPIPSETLPGGMPSAGARVPPPPASGNSVPAAGNPRAPVRARQSQISPQALLFGAVALLLVLALGVTMWMRSRPAVAPVEDPPVVDKGQETPPPPVDPIREHLAKARGYMDTQNYDSAIAEADQVLALDAANTEAADIRLRATQLQTPPPPEKPTVAAPTVKQQQPPPPPPKSLVPAPTIVRGPNETEEEWYRRNAADLVLYEAAKTALASKDYRTAIRNLEQLLKDVPLYQNAPTLLQQAQSGLASASQSNAAEAAKLEAANDLRGALRLYQNVQQQYGVSTAAEQERVRGRMKVEGTKAFADAETFYSLRKPQALPLYERAYDYLSDDDPNRKVAKERLDALRGRQ